MKVTIEAIGTADLWHLTGTVKLRIYANQSFINSDGQFVPQGIVGSSSTAYLEVDCTVVANVLTIPAIEIDSTVDALTNIYATYTAEFIASSRRVPFLTNFVVNTLEDGDDSTTWGEIVLLRDMLSPQSIPDSLTRQLLANIQLAVGGLNKASSTNFGVTKLSVDPDIPSEPVGVGINDPDYLAAIAGGSGGAGVDVASFATDGDGTEGDPWTGWDTAITWTAQTEYHFRSGWFAYATSPNFMKPGIALLGEAGTTLKHTGEGDAFVMASPNPGVEWVHRARVDNFTIVGNFALMTGTATGTVNTGNVIGTGTAFLTETAVGQAISFDVEGPTTESRIVIAIADDTHLTVEGNWTTSKAGVIWVGKSRHGMFLNGIRDCLFSHISVRDVAQAALCSERCVTNMFNNFVLSPSEPVEAAWFHIRSQYGIKLDESTTTWTFVNAVVETTQTLGIWITPGSYANLFLDGTSEAHKGKGAFINSQNNVFLQMDFEVNDDTDVQVLGSRNQFIGCLIAQNIVIDGGQGNRIIGGTVGDITNNGDLTVLDGAQVDGAITDNSGTLIRYPHVNTLDGGLRVDMRVGNVLDWTKTLVAGAVVNTNAREGMLFTLVSGADFELANPTNAINGQRLVWRIIQGASHTITFGGKFRPPFSKEFPRMPPTGEALYICARYNATDDTFDLLYSSNEVFALFEASDITARDINATGGISIDDTQVITNQQPEIANPDGTLVGATTTITSILDSLRNHGLIAITPPFDIDQVEVWYKAGTFTYSDNDLVNKWKDISGNVRHLTQSSAVKKPLFKINQVDGKPIVRFDGANDQLKTITFAYAQPVCVSLVLKRFNNLFKYVFSGGNSTGVALFQGDGASDDRVSMYAGLGTGDPSGVIDSGVFYLVTAEYNSGGSNIYENGVLAGDSPGNPGVNNGSGLSLGGLWDGSSSAQVDVAELVIYDPSIRADVEAYLMAEYNL